MKLDFSLNDLNLENMGIWPFPVKIITTILIFLVILFLGYKLDLSSKLNELEQTQKEEETLKQNIIIKQHLAANLHVYQNQMVLIEKKFQFLLGQLPTKSEIPGLLEDISKSGIANGLEFKLFKPLPEKKNDFYAELPIDIAVIGTYHQIAQFISQIVFLDRIVTLHDFKLAQLKEDDVNPAKKENDITKSNDDKLLLEIKAKTYRYITKGS